MTALKLPRLTNFAISDKTSIPTREFSRMWNDAMSGIEENVNGIQAALDAATAANAAAVTANAAATAATSAASTANTAATTAQTTATAVTDQANLANSYVTGLTISAADTGIDVTATVSAHTRIMGDGTSYAVSGGSVTGLAYSMSFWIYYDDPARAGGAVTYQATSTYANAFASSANPNRFFVGAVVTPAALASPTFGKPTIPPGFTGP